MSWFTQLIAWIKPKPQPMPTFSETTVPVANRGRPPLPFLSEMLAWGKTAPEEIFGIAKPPVAEGFMDVYDALERILGPYQSPLHRRAVMLEIMRVLAGFESSWNWNEGVDKSNTTSITPDTIEAGAWQVSANSLFFGPDLCALVKARVGTRDGWAFQRAMKQDHPLAMEYIARLLRHTIRHNGPVLRHEIDRWLSKAAVEEWENLLSEKVE